VAATLAVILDDTPLRVVHVLLLVSWLGIDVGVFYSSFVLRRRALSGDARSAVGQVMLTLDLAPRISMILAVPVAVGLAYASGLGLQDLSSTEADTIFFVLVAAAFVWIAALLRSVHLREAGRGAGYVRGFRWANRGLRALVAAFFAVTGALSLAGTHEFWVHQIALKAVVFAGVIVIGTLIDPASRDFGPALQDIVANGETPARLDRLNRSLRYAYPLVLAVYVGLITLAVIGLGGY
jgi:hypothetical protein